jgi:hypothetical protein
MDLEQVVRKARERDLDAFAEVVRRFQHMAFGYALSLMRDLQHAEDVVQEAFVATSEALEAITRLPASLREVVTLFYVHDCSQQDVATFLGIPVTTVNNRLHAARVQLKRRRLGMVKDTLHAHQLADDFPARIGRIVRTREPVLEARFDAASLPDILTEVVRCVPIAPVDELPLGASVMSSGRRTDVRVSREVIDRATELLASDRRGSAPRTMLETASR